MKFKVGDEVVYKVSQKHLPNYRNLVGCKGTVDIVSGPYVYVKFDYPPFFGNWTCYEDELEKVENA